MFLTWHKILEKKIQQILQFSAVVRCVNQYDEFLFFNCTKNSAHLKIVVPGLRGPAGSPCKSKDITGWGLMLDFVPASFNAFFKSFSVRVVFFLRLTSIMLYILPEIYLLMFSLHMLSPPVTI